VSKRTYRIRLSARYHEPANEIDALLAECEEDGEWREFVLGPEEPGFVIFVYAIANCQHQNLRSAAAERGLELDTAEGEVEVVTDADWRMQKLHVHFDGELRSGRARTEDVDAIIGRMRNCAVSVNLADVRDTEISLRLK